MPRRVPDGDIHTLLMIEHEKTAAQMRLLLILPNIKYLIKGCRQDLLEQQNFIRIQMPLPNFDFSNRASCDVASIRLQLCRNLLLCQLGSFTERANVFPYSFLYHCIHLRIPPHLFKSKALDIIINV